MSPELIGFSILALILSVVIHEVSHGYVANMLGDPTARLQGRLTLNPIKHIDPLGSVILPVLLVVTGANILIGWAKPVPYNPYNLRDQKYGEAKVAGAGPLVNIGIAVVFGLLIRLAVSAGIATQALLDAAGIVVYINILLAIFNMIPIPPLDGSKVLSVLLPTHLEMKYKQFQDWVAGQGFIVLFLFIFLFLTLLWPVFATLLSWVFTLLTGLPGIGI